MALSVDPLTHVITVPKADLTLIQSTPTEIRELDLNAFRLNLKSWEDSEEGMPQLKTHTHNTEVSLGGLTFARVIEILDPYTITFEDGQYAVNLTKANSNVGDKVNVNQVSVRSQNSAGLISSPAIEFASFNGGVIVDTTSSYSGTVFPIGTEQAPVNNIADALLIADYRGFNKIYLHSDLTISTADLSNMQIVGRSHVLIGVVIEAAASVANLRIDECNVSGTLDGGTELNNCVVGDINYVNGHIHKSGLMGTIVLGGNDDAVIANCYTIDQDHIPIVDMGEGGQSLAMPNYSGLVIIKNLTDANNEIGVGLNAGRVVLDSTITAGTIIVSGTGVCIDNTTGSASVNISGLISNENVADAVWNHVVGNRLAEIEGGRWKIENNQMIFYGQDNVTEVSRFNLFDSSGSATETNVFERVRVTTTTTSSSTTTSSTYSTSSSTTTSSSSSSTTSTTA